MPRKRADVLAALTRKGFVEVDGGDHHVLLYHRKSDGKRTGWRTKASRGTLHRYISDINLGNMAKTAGLTRARFLELVDCPLTREQFEEQVGV